MNKILRVDLTNGKIFKEKIPEEYIILGGRALIDRVLTKEIDPNIHPLSKYNKLIIAPGLFAGTSVPNSGRLSIGGKSPLTSGIKEANSGGIFATKLARLGIKAIILEGKPETGKFLLVLKEDLALLEKADDFEGLGNYELSKRLRNKFNNNIAIASIGPAGESMLTASTIAISDTNGYPSRHCARGGLGAVMGSKGIKAIVVDDNSGKNQKPLNAEIFKVAVKEAVNKIKDNPRIPFFNSKGTPGLINGDNERGSLPTRNYRLGSFDKFRNLSADRMIELAKERGGSMGHGCMPGCLVKCSNIFFDDNKKYLTSALEYETLAMLGSNLEIDDMDAIALMDHKCDDYGIDTIEIGSTIGVLGETEYFEFGDKEKALSLIDEIGKGSVLGKILGQGVTTTCRVFGIDRVPAVKGQAIPGHCARSMKGLGVTYATSPQGADHTAGFIADDPLNPEGQVEKSLTAQINMLNMDSLGLCFFSFLTGSNELFSRLINGLLDLDLNANDVVETSRTALKEEVAFNLKAGITTGENFLPTFLETESLMPKDAIFDVPQEEMHAIFSSL